MQKKKKNEWERLYVFGVYTKYIICLNFFKATLTI